MAIRGIIAWRYFFLDLDVFKDVLDGIAWGHFAELYLASETLARYLKVITRNCNE